MRCVNCLGKMKCLRDEGKTNSTYECQNCKLRIGILIQTKNSGKIFYKLEYPYSKNEWVELNGSELKIIQEEVVVFT